LLDEFLNLILVFKVLVKCVIPLTEVLGEVLYLRVYPLEHQPYTTLGRLARGTVNQLEPLVVLHLIPELIQRECANALGVILSERVLVHDLNE